MARGFLSGIVLGSVVGVGVTGVASVLAPLPNPPQVSDAAPGAVAASAVPSETSAEGGSQTDRPVSTAQGGSQVQTPQADTLEAIDSAALSAADQPLAGNADATLTDPDGSSGDSGVDVAGDAPVLPNPQALAPMAPQDADDLSISTEPAQPPAPVVVAEESAFEDAPAEEVASEDVGVSEEVVTEEVITEEVVAAEEPVSEEIVSEEVVTEEVVSEEVAAAQTEDAVSETSQDGTEEIAASDDAPLAPQPVPDTVADVVPEDVVPEDEAPEAAPEAPQAVDTTTELAAVRPRIGTPVGTLTDRDNGVTIRRPSSQPQAQVDGEETAAEAVTEAAAIAPNADPRPVSRYAQKFDDPQGKPLMAIVLIDDGSSAVAGTAGIAALRSFPYPLTFAVDASIKDAEERMTIYRNEGFEVMAMVDLPDGAVATDAETTFGAVLPQMPEIVGILEGTKGGLQGSREVSDQITSILQQSGHGLLTQDKGLNTMPKIARKEGVPADPIFRDFDSKGQTAAVIRRFLDQAAFKAGQEGAVVMLGRLRPDTISALLLWGLQDRAGKVALTPVSAVLLRDG